MQHGVAFAFARARAAGARAVKAEVQVEGYTREGPNGPVEVAPHVRGGGHASPPKKDGEAGPAPDHAHVSAPKKERLGLRTGGIDNLGPRERTRVTDAVESASITLEKHFGVTQAQADAGMRAIADAVANVPGVEAISMHFAARGALTINGQDANGTRLIEALMHLEATPGAGITAHWGSASVDESIRGQGIASALQASMVGALQQVGVTELRFDATSLYAIDRKHQDMNGGYTWAKMGLDFATPEEQHRVTQFYRSALEDQDVPVPANLNTMRPIDIAEHTVGDRRIGREFLLGRMFGGAMLWRGKMALGAAQKGDVEVAGYTRIVNGKEVHVAAHTRGGGPGSPEHKALEARTQPSEMVGGLVPARIYLTGEKEHYRPLGEPHVVDGRLTVDATDASPKSHGRKALDRQEAQGVHLADMADHADRLLEKGLADPDVARSATWYHERFVEQQALARTLGIPQAQVAGVTAALSVQNAWDVTLKDGTVKTPNWTDTKQLLQVIHDNEPITLTAEHAALLLQSNVKNPETGKVGPIDITNWRGENWVGKTIVPSETDPQLLAEIHPGMPRGSYGSKMVAAAIEVTRGVPFDEALGADASKVRSFYTNMTEPNRDGPVTVDMHMIRALSNDPVLESDSKKFQQIASGKYQYEAYATATRHVAAKYGIRAHEAQAIIWYQWRKEQGSDDLVDSKLRKHQRDQRSAAAAAAKAKPTRRKARAK